MKSISLQFSVKVNRWVAVSASRQGYLYSNLVVPNQTMKNFYKVSILLLLATSHYSCKPEPQVQPKEPVFTAIPKEVKDYCVFKYGSYWIYQDSVSGAYDTVTVQSYKVDTVNYPLIDGQLVGINETFGVKLFHSYDRFDDNIIYKGTTPPPYKGHDEAYVTIQRIKQNDVHDETGYMHYPFGKTNPIIDYMDTVKLLFQSDSILHYRNSFYSGYGYKSTDNYHKRNVGIIRKEIKSKNQVWKLIDFHVNQ